MLGDSVEVTEGYRSWWSYVPHFIGTPGYVYAYAYGQLLALSVYGRYLEEGESFVPRYLELLSAGGSRSPEDLGAIAGLDLTDPEFWNDGLKLVRGQLDEAEEAAAAAVRLIFPHPPELARVPASAPPPRCNRVRILRYVMGVTGMRGTRGVGPVLSDWALLIRFDDGSVVRLLSPVEPERAERPEQDDGRPRRTFRGRMGDTIHGVGVAARRIAARER